LRRISNTSIKIQSIQTLKIMNNELYVAHQIKRHLNAGLASISREQTERLRIAREQALARKRPDSGAVVVGASGSQGVLGGASASNLWSWLAQLVPLAVLLAGLMGIYTWHQVQRVDEITEIDAQMLTDELPPNAYLDRGFGAWLKRGE
jgi:predicted signal transduction protein with EAL and GGDEF domain